MILRPSKMSNMVGGSDDTRESSAVEEFTNILKLVEKIKQKIKFSINILETTDENVFYEKLEDLGKLKFLCSSNNAVASLTACQGMVSLVHSNCIPLQYAFSFFQTLYFHGSVPKGQSSAVLSLLLLDLKAQLSENGKYKNPIRSTIKHPLCKILRQDPNSWKHVLNLMSSVINHYDTNIRDNSLELLNPVFIFILIDNPSSLPETCLHHTWKLLVEKLLSDDKDAIFDYFSSPFFQSCTRDPLEICYDIIVTSQICQSDTELKSALTLILTSLISDVLTQGYDPCSLLSQLNILLDSSQIPSSVLLIILSQSIKICPASFLASLLDFCEWLINKGQCSSESIFMCALACLPWLNNCVSLSLKSVHKSIMAIMAEAATGLRVDNNVLPLMKNRHLPKIIHFNKNIPLAIHTARFCDELRTKDEIFVVQWLNSITDDLIVDVHLLVEAIMSCRGEASIRMSALKTLQRAPISLASENLMFFTYQLAREKEPKFQLELLKSIVSTAVDKKNIPHVMQTIKTLQNSGQPALQILAVDLCLQLWLINELCYPFLLSVLTENKVSFSNQEYEKQMDIACAAAMYQICSKAPDKHGKELVQPLQNLLIKCQGADASSLIMKSLSALIRAKILSPSSTWIKLQPLLDHMHPSVCVSMCELVGVAVKQSCTEEVNIDMCSWLWKLIISSETEIVIVEAALRALREYDIETMKFSSIPDIFKKNISLPSDTATSGNLVDAVPGDCWIQFLENVRPDARQSGCETIACWLSDELERSRTVHDASSPYPGNYNKLPYHSVCKSLYNQLRRSWNKCIDEKNCDIMVKLLLQIFNKERSKLLPPVDWKFIHNCHELKEVEESVLTLMAKESKGCMSAKTFIKNHLNGNSVSNRFLYEHLSDLVYVCCELERNVREKLFKETLFNEKDGETACYYWNCVRNVIGDQNVERKNKWFLIEVVGDGYRKFSDNDPVFSIILDCCIEVSEKFVTVNSNRTMVEFPSKAYKLNYKMALFGKSDFETPFDWLEQCIDIYAQFSSDMAAPVSPLSDLKAAFIKLRTDKSAWVWAMTILKGIAENRGGYYDFKSLDFRCSVFISAVLQFSEISVLSAQLFENAEEFYFPLALKIFDDKHSDSANDFYAEILELLKELMDSDLLLDESVKRVFNSAIAADFALPFYKL